MDAIKRALGGSGAGAGARASDLQSADYDRLLPMEQAWLAARKNQPTTKTKLACTVERTEHTETERWPGGKEALTKAARRKSDRRRDDCSSLFLSLSLSLSACACVV